MKSYARRQGGGTLIGFILGLVIGLAIAVAVTLVITKAPIPFINKIARAPERSEAEPAKLPDPNKSLYSHDVQGLPETQAPAGTPAMPAAVPPSAPAGKTAPTAGETSNESRVPISDRSRPDPGDGKGSSLQAGAFKSNNDAESMKAKLALLGFEANISPADRDGATLFRVRLGPYARIDDLNRVRQRLTENGIEAAVVPAGK